jgi:hypothetical protein
MSKQPFMVNPTQWLYFLKPISENKKFIEETGGRTQTDIKNT